MCDHIWRASARNEKNLYIANTFCNKRIFRTWRACGLRTVHRQDPAKFFQCTQDPRKLAASRDPDDRPSDKRWAVTNSTDPCHVFQH